MQSFIQRVVSMRVINDDKRAEIIFNKFESSRHRRQFFCAINHRVNFRAELIRYRHRGKAIRHIVMPDKRNVHIGDFFTVKHKLKRASFSGRYNIFRRDHRLCVGRAAVSNERNICLVDLREHFSAPLVVERNHGFFPVRIIVINSVK